MGLSILVSENATALNITAQWGDYIRLPNEQSEDNFTFETPN
jgi:hypothetical protein